MSTPAEAPDEIVLVDDDEDILAVLADVLREEGFTPMTFRDGTDALAYLARSRPAMVLTDLQLPRMTGQAFVADVRQQYGPDLPIIVMSGTAHPDLARSLPVQDLLAKPFDLDDFFALIRRWAARP